MIRRILYIFFVFALVAGVAYFYWSFKQKNNQSAKVSLFNAIPSAPSVLVTINSLDQLSKEITKERDVLTTLKEIPFFTKANQVINTLDSVAKKTEGLEWVLETGKIHAAWFVTDSSAIQPLYVIAFKEDRFAEQFWVILNENKTDVTPIKKVDGIPIYKRTFPRFGLDNVYAYFHENNVVLGPKLALVEKSAKGLSNQNNISGDVNFNTIQQTSGALNPLNVFLNLDQLSGLVTSIGSDLGKSKLGNVKNLGSWMELDMNFSGKSIMMNGFGVSALPNDFFDLLKRQEPVKFTAPEVIPVSAGGFTVMGISDIQQFRNDYKKYVQQRGDSGKMSAKLEELNERADTALSTFFDTLLDQEVATVYDAQIANQDSLDRLVVIKLKSKHNAEEAYVSLLNDFAERNNLHLRNLRTKIQADYKTEITTYDFPFEGILNNLYGPAIQDENLERVCFYNNFMFLAFDHEALQNAIFENMRNRTLASDQNYQDFAQNLSEHINYFVFTKMPHWKSVLTSMLQKSVGEKWGAERDEWLKFYATGLQMSSLNNLIYNTLYLHYNPEILVKPKTVWESKVDTAIAMKPVWVVNHNTGGKEICVQDLSNKLYLINDEGIVLWEKLLDSPIVGTIEQIDYFKNGKLQLLFSTQNKLILLDRNGNYVGKYPVNFAAKTTAGASIQDYNGNKDYRIFVPCENGKVYLYDKRGNLVSGWNFNRTDHWVMQPVKHFRADNRDFIVFKDKNRIYIQDRRGRTRVKVKEPFEPSTENEMYLDDADKVGRERFVTTDINGTVKYIYVDGTVRETKFMTCTPQHKYLFADVNADGKGDHIFIDQQMLVVYSSEGKELFRHTFGSSNVSGPQIYTFGPKNIKIGVTDIQKKQVYLFNNDGTIFDGFPVTGNTDFSIGFLNASGYRFGLIVGSQNGYLLYYNVK